MAHLDAAVQMLALLLLQRLLPEARLAAPVAARAALLLQLRQALILVVDGGEAELEVYHSAGGLHHWILLVVLDQLSQTVELVAATAVVLLPLAPDHDVGHLVLGPHPLPAVEPPLGVGVCAVEGVDQLDLLAALLIETFDTYVQD